MGKIELIIAFYFQTFIIVLANNLKFTSESNEEGQLEKMFVFSLIRHGARAPYSLNNKNVDSLGKKWDIFKQDLSSVGMRQHYVLGLVQKETHKDLLSENYKIGEVYALSTNRNRTIQSFLSHFQGLYPEGPTITKAQEENAWPPGKIPPFITNLAKNSKGAVGDKINSMPFHLFEGNYFKFKCESIKSNAEGSTENMEKNIKEFNDKHSKILKDKFKIDLNNKSNKEAREILYNFADSFICEYYEGMESYFTDKTEEKKFLDDVIEYNFKDMLDVTYGDKDYYNGRVLMSPTIDNLINFYFKRRIIQNNKEYNYTDPKMLIYSAHDSNIAELMVFLKHSLNIQFNYKIHFASYYNFELYKKVKNSNDDSSVSGKEEDYKLRITFNGEEVYFKDYTEFKSGVKKSLISFSEIQTYCALQTKLNSSTTYIIVIVIQSTLLLGIIVYLVVGIIRSKKAVESTAYSGIN